MQAPTFSAHLRQSVQAVQADLTQRLQAERQRVLTAAPELQPQIDALISLTERGGKRLRAALVWLGAELAGLRDPAAVLPAASAMEMLQSYFLIHDDWMDDDPVRRGGPSVHMMLRSAYSQTHLGDAGAILTGDYAVSLAQLWLTECNVHPAALRVAMRYFAELQRDVVLGQSLDVLIDGDVAAAREGELRRLVRRTHLWKTAAYTTTGPLLLGALLGSADEKLQQAIIAFADPLGVAFQLRDDHLGVFGEREKTGKNTDSDLRCGKKTALLAALSEHADGRAALQGFLRGGGGRAREAAEIAQLRALLARAEVAQRSEQEIAAEAAAARTAIAALSEDARLRALCTELIDLVVQREA